MRVEFPPGCVAFISAGGPMRVIQVNGKRIEFEMHRYCGPTVLNKRTDEPLRRQPRGFLEAASLWAQQGERIDESGLCVWDHEPEPIVEHLGGKHYKLIGHKPARRGE